jgi:hypothetical protein
MSTEFVPGQNARAIRNTASVDGISVVKGAQVTVEALPSAPFPTFVGRLEAETGLVFDTADFEPVEPPEPYKAPISGTPATFPLSEVAWLDDTTPAPLDPSKVKAGDTVTLHVEYDDASNGKPYDISGEVTLDTYGSRWIGPVMLEGEQGYEFTLTDHQPAPKPEWKPGTTGTATVRGVEDMFVVRLHPNIQDGEGGYAWASTDLIDGDHKDINGYDGTFLHTEGDVTDFVPDETRPLPTRDEVREALTIARHEHESHVATYPESDDGMRGQDAHQAEAIDALLRGESR